MSDLFWFVGVLALLFAVASPIIVIEREPGLRFFWTMIAVAFVCIVTVAVTR